MRVLIEEAKIRNCLNENDLALCIGICKSALTKRKQNPELITLKELSKILELTGKEMRFVEKL